MRHAEEVARGERFEFGRNWQRFLALLSEERIALAEHSLSDMVGLGSLAGKRFLDVGSGSGLFSLAARRLGAEVHSFDYDPQSAACTRELRRRYFPGDPCWMVEEGSILDQGYVASLRESDIVYSWGVLHHTGAMWQALDNIVQLVRPSGLLFIAIYNDMGEESVRWRRKKKRFCTMPATLRAAYAVWTMLPYELKSVGRAILDRDPRRYFRLWSGIGRARGMNRWFDILDWAGGYPYEFASAEAVERFYRERGFVPQRVQHADGLGCNEFVFRRDGVASGAQLPASQCSGGA